MKSSQLQSIIEKIVKPLTNINNMKLKERKKMTK
jgi:hypothetical protein